MARIRIEDLPTVTDLNAEELEEIFGAGKFSFKPAFESLGAREMMDAGIGGAFMSSMAGPPNVGVAPAEQVRMFDSTAMFEAIDVRATPRNEVALAAKATAPGAAVTQADVTKVTEEAFKFLKDKVIAGGKFANVWGLYADGRESLIKTEVVGDEIRLTFSVYYRNVTTPAKVQLNFGSKFEGGVKTYTLAGAGLHDYDDFFLGRASFFEGEVKANFQKNYSRGIRIEAYNPDANKFDYGKEEGRFKDQLEAYIKARVGAELKSFTAEVERTSDGFILKGSFRTKEYHPGTDTNPRLRAWETARFEFRLQLVGFADGNALYACVGSKDRVVAHERDGGIDRPSFEHGTIERWGMNGGHFSTVKPPSQMISPSHLANQVFMDAQRVLSGQGYKGFEFGGHEYMADGLRVNFRAQAADGSWQSFALDVKTEGLRNYRTVRATNNFNTLTITNDQYNPVLSALVRDVHGSWMWKQDTAKVAADAVALYNKLGNLSPDAIERMTVTETKDGIRITLDYRYVELFGQKPKRVTLDIKINGEVGTGYSCVAADLSQLVDPKSRDFTAEKVAKITETLLTQLRANE